MKLKLEFLLPDIKAANQVCDRLLLARVGDDQIHFLARSGLDLGKLQAASAFEKSNIIHEGERGVLMGAGLGLLAGLYVLKFPPWLTQSPLWYSNTHWYIILTITIIAGAFSVAIGAALLGVNLFNSDLIRYKTRIDKGEILMIVTVPFYQANKIRKILKLHHHADYPSH
jgi:hypothetical protein